MLLHSLQQFDINPTDFITVLATAALVLFFVLAALTLPLLGVVTELLHIAKGKAFYEKCAKQISQAAFGAGIFIFMVVGFNATVGLALYRPDMLVPPLLWRPVSLFVPPFAALCLLAVYLFTWQAMRRRRALHVVLGVFPAFMYLVVFFSGFLLLASLQQPMLPLVMWDKPGQAFAALAAEFFATPYQWLMLAFLFCTGMASGGGLVQLWLIVRRFKADYGRDYYVFAMHYCARVALAFTVASTLLGVWVFLRLKEGTPPEFVQSEDTGVLLVAFGLPVVCSLLWFIIQKSPRPLRHKAGAFFACFFLVLAICAQLLMMLNTFPLV